MNIMITSEHRVGSRWLHYLLADLYDMGVSPELDAKKIKANVREILSRFKKNKIVKFHHALYDDISDALPADLAYKVIGVVRDPRDRAVSFAFHNRYHKSNYPFEQRYFDTDFEAVKYTVMDDKAFKVNTVRQFELMGKSRSTKRWTPNLSNYIWTTYEWMKENTLKEITEIADFIGEPVSAKQLKKAVKANSFKAKSGRVPGAEQRKSLWRRKGIVGDHLNWFDEAMMYATEDDYIKYMEIVNGETQENIP